MGKIIQFSDGKKKIERKYHAYENIIDVANYFLNKNAMTLRKVQFLCYYTQCYYLAKYHKRLMDISFEAWANGPTSRELYNHYHEWENLEIRTHAHPQIGSDRKHFMDVIYYTYSPLSTDYLLKFVKQDGAYSKIRFGLEDRTPCTKNIPDELMKNSYEKFFQ